MGVFVFASLSWVFSARKWFRGPVRTVDEHDRSLNQEKEKDGVQVEECEVSMESPEFDL